MDTVTQRRTFERGYLLTCILTYMNLLYWQRKSRKKKKERNRQEKHERKKRRGDKKEDKDMKIKH